MNSYQRVILIVFAIAFPLLCPAQIERWVYRYSGTNTYNYDEASCLIYGSDGNIYAGGYTYNEGTNRDFTIISLTNSGSERWVYKYLTSGNNWDECYSICYGNDGNIYAAGDCTGSDSLLHFTIISLTTNGVERWVYQYPDVSFGEAICYGSDGNIYAVGSTEGKILVVRVDTNGTEDWHYIYPAPSGDSGHGMSIIYGLDGNLYITGYTGPTVNKDVIVISLTPSDSARWVYLYDGSGSQDYGMSIINAPDNNLYIFGSTCDEVGPYLYSNGLVISLTNSGTERWTYQSTTGLSQFESGVYGADGNLYAAGAYGWDIPFFLVESISDSGTYRWHYIDTTWGFATSITCDSNGNIYTCGITSDTWQGGNSYFTIISFLNNGAQRWIYRRHGWGNYSDIGYSLIYGDDGNIYAGGTICDSITCTDFTVISLSSTGILEGERLKVEGERLSLMVLPSVVRDNARIQYAIPEKQRISLKLYDILGRQVAVIADGVIEPSIYTDKLDTSNLHSGIYFLVLEGKKESRSEKILVIK